MGVGRGWAAGKNFDGLVVSFFADRPLRLCFLGFHFFGIQ